VLLAVAPVGRASTIGGITIVSGCFVSNASSVATASADIKVICAWGIAFRSELGAADISLATGISESETGRSSEVLAVRAADSGVFRDSARTIDVEVGSRMPKEMSSEFQSSFIRDLQERSRTTKDKMVRDF
jgi:hypothetical protein